jgi:hypothetical protein
MDAFDSPSTLEAVWGRLVASYAMDAGTTPDKTQKSFTAKAAGVLVERVAEQSCQAFNAVGLGNDLRFEAAEVLGQCLLAEDCMVHLSVFPRERPRHPVKSPGLVMRPPSERRH